MPSLQVVDTTENKPEPTGVQEFFSKLGKSYKDQADRVEIGKLIDDYSKNRQDVDAWQNLQLNLEKSNVSPNRRLEAQKNLNEVKKNLIAQDKVLNSNAAKKQATAKAKSLIGRQREILATGHLGPKISLLGTSRKTGSTFSAEGQALRAEYSRIGKALIQQASTLVIRNKPEFEVLAEDLYDTSKTNEQIKGILDGLERIIEEETGEPSSVPVPKGENSIREGQTATGPKGEKIVFKGGKWQPT